MLQRYSESAGVLQHHSFCRCDYIPQQTRQMLPTSKDVQNQRAESIVITNVLGQVVYSENDCDLNNKTINLEAFENGTKKIPQAYLSSFVRAFGLPAKIKHLGIVEEQETKKILAARLKELRIKKELPQLMVALDLGIARSTYACYETAKNEPDIFTLIKIADYFEVSLDYLVGRTNNDEES